MTLLTAIAILIHCAYILAMDWIHLPGWNDNITLDALRPRAISSLWHGTMGLLFAMAQLSSILWLRICGAVWFSILLLLEINNWWVPYLLGIFKSEISKEIFRKHYASNYTFLPPRKDHTIIPDAQHVVMQMMTLLVAALSWVSVFSK